MMSNTNTHCHPFLPSPFTRPPGARRGPALALALHGCGGGWGLAGPKCTTIWPWPWVWSQSQLRSRRTHDDDTTHEPQRASKDEGWSSQARSQEAVMAPHSKTETRPPQHHPGEYSVRACEQRAHCTLHEAGRLHISAPASPPSPTLCSLSDSDQGP